VPTSTPCILPSSPSDTCLVGAAVGQGQQQGQAAEAGGGLGRGAPGHETMEQKAEPLTVLDRGFGFKGYLMVKNVALRGHVRSAIHGKV
jgi:hypothetical protein